MQNEEPVFDAKLSRPILIYDSECTLCRRFKEAIQKLPSKKKIWALSIRDQSTYQQFPALDESKCHEVVHLIDEADKIHQGPEVIEYLIKYIPGIDKLTWLTEHQVGKKAIDLFYKAVSTYRKSQLGPCKGCSSK